MIHVDVDPVKHLMAPGLMHFKDMHKEPKRGSDVERKEKNASTTAGMTQGEKDPGTRFL